MHRRRFPIWPIWVSLVLFFMLGGCASVEEDRSPEELMDQGVKYMDRGNYELAFEAFQALKDRYPYSKYAIIAELKVADALFLSKQYDTSFDAYNEFEKLHPKDKNIPYVIYQKGMSHFRQTKSSDREQAHTLKAKAEFERLLKRFPKDIHAERASLKTRECVTYLAEHELYVGHFYFKMKKYKAAMGRYTYLIQNYPDMGQYYEALEYISRRKEKLAEQQATKDESSKNHPE